MRRGMLSRTLSELPTIALYGGPGILIAWVCCLAVYSLFVVPFDTKGYVGMVLAILVLFFMAKLFLREVVESLIHIYGRRRLF